MRIVFIVACGHGRVCAEIASLMLDKNGLKKYDEILFLDNNEELKICSEYPVVGVEDDFEEYIKDETDFFVSIGNCRTRKRIDERIIYSGGRLATLIHPRAVISADVEIDMGSVVMAGAVINPAAKIGRGTIINTSSSVDHDTVVKNYSHIAVGSHL